MNIMEKEGVAVCVIPKVASQSIQAAIEQCEHTRPNEEEAMAFSTRIAFVRDPIERFDSLFSHMHSLARGGSKAVAKELGGSVLGIHPDTDYKSFVNYVLSGHTNAHWLPQSEQLSSIPTDIYRFEDLEKAWERHFTGALPWNNKWTPIEHNPYREDDLKEYYKADYALREKTKWL